MYVCISYIHMSLIIKIFECKISIEKNVFLSLERIIFTYNIINLPLLMPK